MEESATLIKRFIQIVKDLKSVFLGSLTITSLFGPTLFPFPSTTEPF